MRLFIDANIYLSFLETSKEEMKSLDQLKLLLKNKSVKLIFPRITQDEYYRNIPRILSIHCNEIDGYLPPGKPPIMVSVRKKQITASINKAHKGYAKLLKKLKDNYISSIEKINSNYIEKFIKMSEDFNENDDLIERAHKRYLIGNPPGKRKGYLIGDEIEWELLKKYCIDDDLTIITNDGDWKDITPGKKDKINPILLKEWGIASGKKIIIETSLGKFINSSLGTNVIPEKVIKREENESRKIGDFSVMASLSPSSGTAFAGSSSFLFPTSTSTLYDTTSLGGYLNTTGSNAGCASLDGYLNATNSSTSNAFRCCKCGRFVFGETTFRDISGNYYCGNCR